MESFNIEKNKGFECIIKSEVKNINIKIKLEKL